MTEAKVEHSMMGIQVQMLMGKQLVDVGRWVKHLAPIELAAERWTTAVFTVAMNSWQIQQMESSLEIPANHWVTMMGSLTKG